MFRHEFGPRNLNVKCLLNHLTCPAIPPSSTSMNNDLCRKQSRSFLLSGTNLKYIIQLILSSSKASVGPISSTQKWRGRGRGRGEGERWPRYERWCGNRRRQPPNHNWSDWEGHLFLKVVPWRRRSARVRVPVCCCSLLGHIGTMMLNHA